MITTPSVGFSAEYLGDHPAYDRFDEYLRIELAKRHPGWEPRFGKVTWFDPTVNRFDYAYLLTGNVPGANHRPTRRTKSENFSTKFLRG
jgi:hypothetical protein